MHIPKVIGYIAALLILVAMAVCLRLWWATLTPKVPNHWPPGSVWVAAPPAPLDWSPRGDFAGCWSDDQQKVNRCQFANYKGTIWYQGDYIDCDSHVLVAEDRLAIKSQADWIWVKSERQELPRVHLLDGTMLIPFSACEAHKSRENLLQMRPTVK